MNIEKHLSIFMSTCLIIVAIFSCEKKIEQSLSTTKNNSTTLLDIFEKSGRKPTFVFATT